MPSRTKQLAENSLMLGISAVLLFLGTYTFLGVFLYIVYPLPFIMLAVRRNLKDMLFIVGAFTFLGFIIASFQGAFSGLMAGLTGMIMGLFYKKRNSAIPAIMGGAGMWFVSFVLGLAFLTFVLGIDVIAQMQQAGKMLANGEIPFYMPQGMSKEEYKKQIESALTFLISGLPAGVVMMSFLLSGINHWLARLISNRLGRSIPALKPFSEWSFPRTLLLYYFVTLLAALLSGNTLLETGWGKAVVNVNIILSLLFFIQGLSLCFYALNIKGWKKFAPLLFIALFIFPFLANILSLLGIIDLGMGLRKKLETRK